MTTFIGDWLGSGGDVAGAIESGPSFRLVDGSQPEDWHPNRGDAPCDVSGHEGHEMDGCPSLHAPDCECGRGVVAVAAFQRNTSLLVRRIVDMGHERAADWRCVDCVADMAVEVGKSDRAPWHPDFGGPGMTEETR